MAKPNWLEVALKDPSLYPELPSFATSKDTPTGRMDDLGRREYQTPIGGQKYFLDERAIEVASQTPRSTPSIANVVPNLQGAAKAVQGATPLKVGKFVLNTIGSVYGAVERTTKGTGTKSDFGVAAGMVPLGGSLVAVPRGSLRSFGGVNAKRPEPGMVEADRLIREGRLTNKQIHKKTGWFMGLDGQLRFEFSDADAVLTPNKNGKLGDVLKHYSLFRNYPELRDINVRYEDFAGEVAGHFDEANNEIVLKRGMDPEKARSVLIHEVGHGIQKREGFETGASVRHPEVVEQADQEYMDMRDFYKWNNTDPASKALSDKALEVGDQLGVSSMHSGNLSYHLEAIFDEAKNRDIKSKELAAMFGVDPKTLGAGPNHYVSFGEAQEAILKHYSAPPIMSYKSTLEKVYSEVAGEVEARLAQYRMNMKQKDLRKFYPYGEEDLREVWGDKGVFLRKTSGSGRLVLRKYGPPR
jgi:hypothetical protein